MGADMKRAGRRTAERDPERGFAIGDRVRLTAYHDEGPDVGATGTYRGYVVSGEFAIDFDAAFELGHNCCGLCKEGHGWFVPISKLEPAPAFKVGDRVEPTAVALEKVRDEWRMGHRLMDVPDVFFVVGEHRGRVAVSATQNGAGRWFDVVDFQLADGWDRPPVVRIEAGKFYRTRGGVKVGPMKEYLPSRFTADTPVAGVNRVWGGDGTHGSPDGFVLNERSIDIIAEWVEPATNDNAPVEPAPHFKVGDRVTHTYHTGLEGLVGIIRHDDKTDVPFAVEFNGWSGGHDCGGLITADSGRWCSAHHLKLVEPVATVEPTDEPTKFKVGDRVKIAKYGVYILPESAVAGQIVETGTFPHGGSWKVDIDNYDGCPLTFYEDWLAPAEATAPGKFKVGDRVRLYRHSSALMNAPDGSTATVGGRGVFYGFDGVGPYVDIVWDRTSLSFSQHVGGYWPSDFELISPVGEPPTTAIVAVYIDGHPAPAHRPHVHTSKESATTEAERLAKLNPGNEFGVFQLVAKRVADVTVRAV